MTLCISQMMIGKFYNHRKTTKTISNLRKLTHLRYISRPSDIITETHDNDFSDTLVNLVTSEISERDRKLQYGYALNIDISQSASVINQSQHHTTVMSNNQTSNGIQNESVTQYEFPTILKLIVNSTKTNPFDSDDDDSSCDNIAKSHKHNQTTQQPCTPTMIQTLQDAEQKYNINLDKKQLLAYQMVCATFMMRIIRDQTEHMSLSDVNNNQMKRAKAAIEQLRSLGGKDQLILFLTGPAGAGKTTAIKLAQKFCNAFSDACNIPFDQYTFFFTAYTGAAASDSGG